MQNNKILPLLLAALYQITAHAEPVSSQDLINLQQEMTALQEQLDKLAATTTAGDPASPYGLQLSGFFDITANVSNMNGHPFSLGDLEVDALYDTAENFAVSAAGIVNDEGASVGVAILDYHVTDHNIPARGELYEDAGYHLQLGRFDIPFASDYNFYAAPDRTSISAPLTTSRIQDGGLNGDGMRIYGRWSALEYTLFWTNSLFADTGYSVGTRLGYAINDNFVTGISVLNDRDANDNTRNDLTALDIGWHMGMVELNIEAVQRDSINNMEVNNIATGPADEKAAHISLALDFSPLILFVRYETWTPDYSQRPDATDNTIGYNVEQLERLTLAGRYMLDDYLQFKAEYFNYINGETTEPDFSAHQARLQMVARF